MGDTEEGVCFVGKIPTKDNEIMIGNSYEYYLMNGIYDKSSISSDIEDTKEKSSEFLEKYKDGLDITMGDFSSYSYDISNIKIVGAYAYKKNGQLYNLVNNDYIIINSSLMDKMLEDIYNNGLIINNLGSYYYSKNELKKSFKRILNNDLYINVDNFDDYKSAMNMDSFSNSMIGISLFIFVISTLTILVYLHNSYKSISKDLLVMQLNNIKKKHRRLVLNYFTSLVLIPFLVAIPLCFVYLNLISNLNLTGIVDSGSFVFNYFYPILSLVILLIFYYLISFIYSSVISKKGILKVLKNE